MLTKKELVNKWKSLGFMDDIPEHQMVDLAEMYENTAQILLSGQFKAKCTQNLNPILFAVVRRIFVKKGYKLDKIRLLMLFKRFDEEYQSIIGLHSSNIDIEAEFTANFCDNYEITN